MFLVCTLGIGLAFAMGYWNRYARPIDRSPVYDSLGTQVRAGDMIQWTDRTTGDGKTRMSSVTTYRMIVGTIDERHWIVGQAYIVGGWGDWGQKELDGYRTDYTVILRNCTLKMQNSKLTAICVKE